MKSAAPVQSVADLWPVGMISRYIGALPHLEHNFATGASFHRSRVAKLEAGDPSVSLDLLIRSLLALGLTATDLARIIAPQPSTAAI